MRLLDEVAVEREYRRQVERITEEYGPDAAFAIEPIRQACVRSVAREQARREVDLMFRRDPRDVAASDVLAVLAFLLDHGVV